MIPDITLTQALDVYTDLFAAYNGTHGYGGNTAEIYLYRLFKCNPTRDLGPERLAAEERAKDTAEAALALRWLIKNFTDRFPSNVTVDGKPYRSELTKITDRRVHVKIIPIK